MLPGAESAAAPFWSPDGRWIGFYANGMLKKISPDGGPPRTIAALPSLIEAVWGANGDILYRPRNRTPLYRIHESGGPSRQVTKLDAERTENSHRSPVFLPDGRRFLFTTRCGRREHNGVYIGSLDSTEVRRLMPLQSNVKYVPAREGDPGLLLGYRDSMLMGRQFDADRDKLAGDPVPVIGNVAYSPAGAIAEFDVAAAGNLVILRPASATARQLTWFSRSGAVIGVTGPRGDYYQPRLSPQSDRIAFTRSDEQTGNRDIWSIEVARGVSARLTTHEANDWFPVWSPDGKHMMFGSDREGGTHNPPHLKKSMDLGSHESRLPYDWGKLGVPYDRVPYDWSRDGRWVTMGSFDIWVAPVSGDGKPFPFLATSFNEGGARFSPDAKWIAYSSDETGRHEVYVRPFAGAPSTGGGKIRISSAGGNQPVWRADGQELFYVSSDRHLYGVSTRGLTVGGVAPAPARLFRPCTETVRMITSDSIYDTQDGQRFVFTCRTEPPGNFVVLMNWAARR